MAVEYNSSAEYHTNKLREAELAKTVARRRGGAAALRAQNAGAATPGEDGEAASSPQNEGELEPPPRQSQQPTVPPSEDDRAVSPASSTSSDSEPPLAQRASKANGSNHASSVTPAPTSSGPVATQASPQVSPSAPATVSVSVPPTGATPTDPPKWLWAATQSMRSKYPDDTFILKRINGTEWRIKCSDCPGKVDCHYSVIVNVHLPFNSCSCILPDLARRFRTTKSI
jgi:SWI/SNF-related matrix-associated actin-dependent regulator of chromatin subfamily B protein 1